MPRVTAVAVAPYSCLFTLVSVTVAWVGADNGGYFPPAWGWAGLALAWAAVVAFTLIHEIAITRLQLVFVGGLALLTAWSALSLDWTPDATTGVQNVERDLVYIGAVLVAVSLRDRLAAAALRNAVLAGSSLVCVYSLGTRLFPDRLGFYSDVLTPGRLFNPLGYWNAQGVLAALSMLLAAGVVAGRGRTLVRSLTAGLLPLLSLDCYFTLSRGALIALAVGVGVWLVVDPDRIRATVWMLALAPWPALAVWRAHNLGILVGGSFGPQSAATGHSLALQTLGCTLASAGVVATLAPTERRLKVPPWAGPAYIASWALIAVVVALLAVARYGTPVEMTRTAYDGLTAAPPSNSDATRLLSLSLNGRSWLWSVAWSDAKAHPIAGSGLGSFEEVWLRERPLPSDSRWAHSLYLETLAETGCIGLLLLVATLSAPIVAAIRCRSTPATPPVLGVYVAYLVHAGVDWDWQVPALTLAALWCGCALMAAQDGCSVARLAGVRRAIPIAAASALGVLAVFGLLGNRDLALSQGAATRGAYALAAADASAAGRWQPWSYRPAMALGNARRGSGNIPGARLAYRTAINRDPGRWNGWFALAEVSTGSTRADALHQAAERNPLSVQISKYCGAHGVRGCDTTTSSRRRPG